MIEQQVLYAEQDAQPCRDSQAVRTEHVVNQGVQAFTSIIASPFCLSVSGLPLAKASCTFSPARRIWSAVSASRACLATVCLPVCLVRRCNLLCDAAERLSSRWQAHGRRLLTGQLESLRTVSVVCIFSLVRTSFRKCKRTTKRECCQQRTANTRCKRQVASGFGAHHQISHKVQAKQFWIQDVRS